MTIISRATDDSGRMENPGPGITVNVVDNLVGNTLWSLDGTPKIWDVPDSSAIELGVRFQSDEDGWIKALRFYKNTANTGTHVGHLWKGDGTLLATVTFTGETAFGWQQAQLSTPVPITAGTTYVASYHTDTGHYPLDIFVFLWQIGRSTAAARQLMSPVPTMGCFILERALFRPMGHKLPIIG